MSYHAEMPGPLADLEVELGELFYRAQQFGREGLFDGELEDQVAGLFDRSIAEDQQLDAARAATDPQRADQHAHVRGLMAHNHGRRLRWAAPGEEFIDGEHREIRFNRLVREARAAGAGPFAANLAAHRACDDPEA